jgi:hypothetical protein
MRAIVAACVMMASLGVTGAGAADIEGRWGLGAGVVPGGLKVSLFRGTSERSAWLFDVAIDQEDRSRDFQSSTFTSFEDQDTWVVSVGPGYRRFLRPEAEFSPYWDVQVNGLYARSHFHYRSSSPRTLSSTRTDAGVAGQFAFGLEYFFRQHLSVAAHGTVAEFAWLHTSRPSGHVVISSIGLNPVIFLRGYW